MNRNLNWKQRVRQVLPERVYRRVAAVYRRLVHNWIPVGKVDWGSFSRLQPISRQWGDDRGQPINRYYIEKFLARWSHDIQGHVLEIGDDAYTKRFGGVRVTRSDVLHVREGVAGATIIADLSVADHIESNSFDCLIVTQTLHLIYDVHSAIKTIYRILKPGGVVLVTIPGIDPIHDEEWADSWYWNFTTVSARRLFEESFPPGNVLVDAYGNVLASAAFLYGLAAEELTKEQLDFIDPAYQVLVAVKAVKSEVSL